MFNFFVTLLTVAANIFLGLTIFLRNSRHTTNRIFGALTVVVSAWAILNNFSLSTLEPTAALFWIRAVMACTALMLPLIYVLADNFPQPNSVFWTNKNIFILMETIFVMLCAFTTLIFRDVSVTPNGIVPNPGKGVFIFGIHGLTFLALTIRRLIRKKKEDKGMYRAQITIMQLGLGLTFASSFITTFLFVVILKNTNLVILGPAYTLFLVGCVAYAIVKHRFLDITAVVARAVTYALILLVVVALEVAMVAIGVRLLPVEVDRVWVAAAGAIFIVLGYDTLRGVLTRFTERLLFQGRYDTEEVLSTLTHTMASVIDMRKLTDRLLATLVNDMRLTQGAFLLVKDGVVSHIESMNWPNAQALRQESWDEVLDDKNIRNVFEDMQDGPLKDTFRKYGITIAMPLRIKHDEVGILLLGPKASGDIYVERDLELLNIFAPQAAVALNNAKAYQEIQKFSKTLEKKVEERTQELEKSQKEKLAKAKELLKIKDEFVFIATHDLATPVTALRGFVQLLQEGSKKLPKDIQFDVNAIGEATERLKTLVEDLLQVARGDSGTIKVELAKTDLSAILHDAEELVRERAKARNIKYIFKLAKNASQIMADERKLREVIENLFSNAIKYNHDKGSVTVSTTLDGEKVILTVADTGIGIPEKEQGRVFSKFYRSDSDEARMQNGTGLGLFVVKMLVEKMKGTIAFESVEGKGTTFTLTFARA